MQGFIIFFPCYPVFVCFSIRAQLSLALHSPLIVSCLPFTLEHSLCLLSQHFSAKANEEVVKRMLEETTQFVKVIITMHDLTVTWMPITALGS